MADATKWGRLPRVPATERAMPAAVLIPPASLLLHEGWDSGRGPARSWAA
jgi:hypothetical protein